MVRALGAADDVQVVAPVAWPVAYRARRIGSAVGRERAIDGVEVRHPVYYYPPKLLRSCYGTFFRVVDPPDG